MTQDDLRTRIVRNHPESLLTAAAIGKIETGHRGMYVDELVHFAVALEVPIVDILMPWCEEDAEGTPLVSGARPDLTLEEAQDFIRHGHPFRPSDTH